MTNTTYYNLNIVEGNDIVNPLTVDNPNYEKIDETMHNNAVAGVTLATEIANATVHAITRENSDCSVIRFIATSRWKAGDTATVDGVPVTALLPSGETLPDGAYVINANVLCILTGTNLTVYVGGKKVENANQIPYNETNVGDELDKLNGSVEQINGSIAQINGSIAQINSNLESKFNEGIDIMSYNSASNPFVVPNDGMVLLNSGTDALSLRNIRTDTLPFDGIISTVQAVNNNYNRQFINVYKGMKIYVEKGSQAIYFSKK